MIGLVLVSHSDALATGLAEVLHQVAGPDVPVLAAGGGPDGTIGTSPDRIEAAVRQASRAEGAVVLADIGSAVLAVRELLADERVDEARVRLVDAPFVEGAVAAAVTASIGGDLAAVAAAAEEAYGVRKL